MDSPFFEQIFWGNTIKNYCLFAGILLFGVLFKKIISRLLSLLLFRLFKKFASAVKDDTFVGLLLQPIAFFISLCSYYLAINQLRQPLDLVLFGYAKQIEKTKETVHVTLGQAIDKVFLFLIILSVFWIILRIIDFIAHVLKFKASLTADRADDQLVPFLKELAKTIICFFGFFVLLGYVFEINVLTLITGLGIGGIAIALAAKESLENLIGSFTIFLDKPFTVGDVVKVDGVEGTIDKVGFRSTRLISPDKTTIVIPNRAMIDGVLENVTRRDFRRVNFFIGITYETPATAIKEIVTAISTLLTEHPETTDGFAVFDNFGDSALNIQVVYLVVQMPHSEFIRVKEEINFQLIRIVQEHGSDFAYPTQRVVGEEPPAAAATSVG
ncbi:MscS family membrane protein [Pedobacter steynii]|uniref:MscS family membrane protein n=1 Tax=Pedobacter steynii TaxID=430522 RepID=A0A1H0E9W2_9SPHI|nr:mechanosensitive ion channel family protein [Pedobacter steynii]NQX41961.1 mechanosensitive ion channel family protein [Pedobacter steynii]SDN79119.1 MscS family membrane protein [Pedobacter steynii]